MTTKLRHDFSFSFRFILWCLCCANPSICVLLKQSFLVNRLYILEWTFVEKKFGSVKKNDCIGRCLYKIFMIMSFNLALLNMKKIVFYKNGSDSLIISIVSNSEHLYKCYLFLFSHWGTSGTESLGILLKM